METMEVRLERTIQAPSARVFDAWLGAQVPGSPWQEHDELILHAAVNGLWYWKIRGAAHYGRFVQLERPGLLVHTWVSPSTLGLESLVSVRFEAAGQATKMTLIHSGLPQTAEGRGHEDGWNYFLGRFVTSCSGGQP